MEDEPLRVAVARLKTPDGKKYLLQRRNKVTSLFPEGLGFFGGHIEPGEHHEQTIRRELKEELEELGDIALEHVGSMTVLPPTTQANYPVEVHVYDGVVDHDVVTREGASLELYSQEDALSHPELVPTTRNILELEQQGRLPAHKSENNESLDG